MANHGTQANATCFCVACELRMSLIIFKRSETINRRGLSPDPRKQDEIQISVSVNKVLLEQSHDIAQVCVRVWSMAELRSQEREGMGSRA